MKSEALAAAAACGHTLNIGQLRAQIMHAYGWQNMDTEDSF